jgi:hypothetical protein
VQIKLHEESRKRVAIKMVSGSENSQDEQGGVLLDLV